MEVECQSFSRDHYSRDGVVVSYKDVHSIINLEFDRGGHHKTLTSDSASVDQSPFITSQTSLLILLSVTFTSGF